MCQMCEEADLYMAQLEAAEHKAFETKARRDGQQTKLALGSAQAHQLRSDDIAPAKDAARAEVR